MPASPARPTNRVPGPAALGEHAGEHNALARVLNGMFKRVIGVTRTESFSLIQDDQSEVIPVEASAPVAVGVPPLEAGTHLRLVQLGSAPVTFVPESNATLLAPGGTQLGVFGTTARLVWLTDVQVLIQVKVPTGVPSGYSDTYSDLY